MNLSLPNSLPGRLPLGVTGCSPHSIADLLQELKWLLLDKSLAPRTILCLNSHIYNLACSDTHLCQCLSAARIVAADGMAIVWATRLLGHRIPKRCNMTEAYHAFMSDETMPSSRAILMGCSSAEAEAAARRANRSSTHCRVVSACGGFLSESEHREFLATHSEIDLVLIGMGTPKTERLAQEAEKLCPRAVVWGIGGGTIRIEAGTMVEAPLVWRRLGIQWLHRLASEPGQLWRRYLLGNPLFVLRMLTAAWHQYRLKRR
ncbi:MAG: WecB/TagA/CpsF family glycosyltransferase [Verrucomicrobia bacterium]|nr:WecB/TagA/CpsF family glycosyltransferase [Verrucomicrobiota bacterium]